LSSYADALRGGGYEPDTDLLHWVFAASAALRFGIGPAAFMVKGIDVDPVVGGTGIRDPQQRALLEGMLGRPFHEIIETKADTDRYLILELGREALNSLDTIERRMR
jgi:hypothetical protein